MSDIAPAETSRPLRRWRAPAIFLGVAALEIGLFLLLGQVKGRAPEVAVVEDRPFEVVLYDPPPPIPRPPAPVSGGGAPAAPSKVNIPPPPKVQQPRELPAPPKPAPTPAPVVGVAPAPSSQPGFGQGVVVDGPSHHHGGFD